MIPVNGVPLIQYIVKYLCGQSGIKEIIIISDFQGLGEQIQNYFTGQKLTKKMRFVQDSQKGTGGDLLHASGLLKGTDKFVLWFADNFCAVDLGAMEKQFDSKKGNMACIATRSKRKEETGFARVIDGIVVQFQEKPTMDLPLSECLGIYMLDTKILQKITKQKSKKNINLSYDILEELAAKSLVSAYDIGNREWLDVESPVIIDRNQKQVNRIIKQMGL